METKFLHLEKKIQRYFNPLLCVRSRVCDCVLVSNAYKSVRKKSSKENSKTSTSDGAAKEPIAEVGIELWVIILEVWASVVRPRITSRVTNRGSKKKQEHG